MRFESFAAASLALAALSFTAGTGTDLPPRTAAGESGSSRTAEPSVELPRVSMTSTGGDTVFSPAHYTLVSSMQTWKQSAVGTGVVFTPASPEETGIELYDAEGALVSLDVPEGGSVLVAPDCIIVSHGVIESKTWSDPRGGCNDRQPMATTVYASGEWSRAQTGGCAQSFQWNANSNCYESACEGGPNCSLEVVSGGETNNHVGGCNGDEKTSICDGGLYVF